MHITPLAGLRFRLPCENRNQLPIGKQPFGEGLSPNDCLPHNYKLLHKNSAGIQPYFRDKPLNRYHICKLAKRSTL
ncbi:MAG: hypothetical protein LBU34_05060 [Planctomycetaceae bacterium]|nr:hypothetical protein [Planctomycetaceae bacterium]